MRKKEVTEFSKVRPPMTDKGRISTPTPPIVSCGKEGMHILQVIAQIGEKNFTRRGYSSKYDVKPSTTKSRLDALVRDGFLINEYVGLWVLTDKAKAALKWVEPSTPHDEGDYRGVKANLSMHDIKFSLDIFDSSKFELVTMCEWNKWTKDKAHMNNWDYWVISCGSSRIFIKPNVVEIHIEELIKSNVDEAYLESFEKALKLVEQLRKFGMKMSLMRLEDKHFARMKDAFAAVLFKKLGKYYTKLSDGSMMWIDFSNDKQERETNDDELAKRLDGFIDDIRDSKSNLSDVDRMDVDMKDMKIVMAQLLQYQILDVQKQKGLFMQQQKPPVNQDPTGRGNYYG